MDGKKEIRRRLLGLREKLDGQEWQERTQAAFRRAVSHSWFQAAKTIYC